MEPRTDEVREVEKIGVSKSEGEGETLRKTWV
jgi:hypothetical protein